MQAGRMRVRRQLGPDRIAGARFARNHDALMITRLANEVSLFVVVQDRCHQTGPIVIQRANGTG